MGRFIVIEGMDGAGTTTQVALLVERLGGHGDSVVATREPTEGPIGRVLRAALRAEPGSPDIRTLPWLFAADRADHLQRTIEPYLERGSWVVSDRYYHSSLAYQSLTMPLDRVMALNADFRVPDLTVYLDVPVDVALDRIKDRSEREIYEYREKLELVDARYRQVITVLGKRGDRIVVLDGTHPAREVSELIWHEVKKLGAALGA